jgi:hypothetical protein
MSTRFSKSQITLAVVAAVGAAALGATPSTASAKKDLGTYVSGDFHNHTTCSDGSISMQKLVRKTTDKSDGTFGLDWFVQAGHGGNGNRNCTLVEDASLSTPAYPYIEGYGPTTTWQNTPASADGPIQPQGDVSCPSGATCPPSQNMWRWQAIQQFQYPLMEYLNAYLNRPLFIGVESVVAGHEHTSMSVITGQMPAEIDSVKLPTTPGYTPLGDANALAQWQYCFDRGNSDASRGAANQWDCSVPGSSNSNSSDWNATAAKLKGANGGLGHTKTLEGLKWMNEYHPDASYYVPAHLERAGPFNPTGNNGFNIESLRDFNNTAPKVAFGFETQPGHGASSDRGEYYPNRNCFGGSGSTCTGGTLVDSVGGTTWGGTGIYGAQIGGVWDALLGEGRNWWFFASSDWHNRGSFGPDDRRSTQDFYPGEYQRDFVMVQHDGKDGKDGKLTPQEIVNGLRSGNSFATSGQLIDRLAFVACVGNPAPHGRNESAAEALTLKAALNNTDLDFQGCATMGGKLVVPKGKDVVVAIALRDPDGTNYSPYSFNNPSLLQVGIKQPLNKPVLDHVDVIRGMVTSLPKQSGDADYAGEWPRTWLTDPDMSKVPAAAKNTTAALYKTFDDATWSTVKRNPGFKTMVFRIPAVKDSQYVRLRGTNLPASVPYETDADGNPLADVYTNEGNTNRTVAPLSIPCTTVGTNVPANDVSYTAGMAPIDGCPSHLPVVNGQKMVAYDVAAWSDLWFYSNPIFIEVQGSTQVAGVD